MSKFVEKVNVALFIYFFVSVLMGCSAASPIQEAGSSKSAFDDAVFKGKLTEVSENSANLSEYRVFQHGDSGFERMSSVRHQAESRANEFCSQRNLAARTLRERAAVPPYILGNFPRIELIFVCEPSTLIVEANVDKGDKWTQLEALANLRDREVISESEFEIEKSKILNSK